MKIKIIESNRAEIQLALDTVNGTAKAHTAGASAVFRLAELGETELAEVAKGRRKGAAARHISGGIVSNSYKYQRFVTSISIERGADAWYLVECSQTVAWPNSKTGSTVYLTHLQTLDVLAHYAARGVALTLTNPVNVTAGGAL